MADLAELRCLGWNWLNETGNPGWTVVAVADMNNDGVPDLIWQNNMTNQVTVNYYGGAGGATLTGWNWLNSAGEPAGWHVWRRRISTATGRRIWCGNMRRRARLR